MSQRILFLTTHHSYFTRPIATALKQLSYKVKLFDYNRPNLDARLLGFTHNLFPKQTPSKVLENHINQSLLLQVKNYQPDILLAIKADSILPSTIKKINQMNVKTINWFPDWLISWGWIKKTAPVYSVFINSCQKAHQKCLKNKINSQYLPFAAQPDDPLQKLHKIYPITFIGEHSPRREKYFKAIKDLGLHIFGYQGWKDSTLKGCFHGQVTVRKAHQIMRQSQIVVNVLTGNDRFEPQAINVRTFETLGVGSLLLVKSSPVLNKHFKPGKDLITFSSPQDLYKKAKYYLSHKVQADKIALNGYKIVQDKHTFIHRLKEIL